MKKLEKGNPCSSRQQIPLLSLHCSGVTLVIPRYVMVEIDYVLISQIDVAESRCHLKQITVVTHDKLTSHLL